MVKMFAFLPKRPDISDDRFHKHWRDPHGEVTKRITTIHRYVQSHRLHEPATGLPESIYEGIAEAWFDSIDVGLKMGEDPNYIEGAGADEPNFIDLPNLAFLFTTERTLREGEPLRQDTPGVKLVHLLRRDRTRSLSEFAERYERLAGAQTQAIGARRDVLCLAHPDAYTFEEPVFDAVHELWFEDADAYLRSRAQAADAWARLCDADLADGPGLGFLADEYRVIWPEG